MVQKQNKTWTHTHTHTHVSILVSYVFATKAIKVPGAQEQEHTGHGTDNVKTAAESK